MKELKEFKSSNIAKVEYDEDKKNMFVTFTRGGKYCYKNVPNSVFEKLDEATSKGSYFYTEIRSKYEVEKC